MAMGFLTIFILGLAIIISLLAIIIALVALLVLLRILKVILVRHLFYRLLLELYPYPI
jgi:hypothetical protein